MKKDQYFQFLVNTFVDGSGERKYITCETYDKIEIVKGEKYFVYNKHASIILESYGSELLNICKNMIGESRIIELMKEKFNRCDPEILFMQIYFNLAQLVENGFIKHIDEENEE